MRDATYAKTWLARLCLSRAAVLSSRFASTANKRPACVTEDRCNERADSGEGGDDVCEGSELHGMRLWRVSSPRSALRAPVVTEHRYPFGDGVGHRRESSGSEFAEDSRISQRVAETINSDEVVGQHP